MALKIKETDKWWVILLKVLAYAIGLILGTGGAASFGRLVGLM